MSNQHVSAFLRRLKAVIDDVAGVGRCVITSGVTIDKLLNDPVWPTVMVNDAGGIIDPVNGVLWDMRADITLLNVVSADAFGDEDTLELEKLSDDVMAALNYLEDEGVYLAADSSVDSDQEEEGSVILRKSNRLAYTIDTRRPFEPEPEP